MYQYRSRVRYSECSADSTITLSALVNYLQDCCTFQSEDLGIGVAYQKEIHCAWVLSSWQIVIEKLPVMGEEIIVSTWPYNFKGFYGFRNFTIEDKNGTVLAYANSVWVFLDVSNNHPIRINKRFQEAYVLEEAYPMDYLDRKIALHDVLYKQEAFPVQKSHIDTNNHVNNEKYILMAQEYIPQTAQIGQIRVEYKKAAVLGDMIYPASCKINSKWQVSLANEGDEPYAIVEFFQKGD